MGEDALTARGATTRDTGGVPMTDRGRQPTLAARVGRRLVVLAAICLPVFVIIAIRTWGVHSSAKGSAGGSGGTGVLAFLDPVGYICSIAALAATFFFLATAKLADKLTGLDAKRPHRTSEPNRSGRSGSGTAAVRPLLTLDGRPRQQGVAEPPAYFGAPRPAIEWTGFVRELAASLAEALDGSVAVMPAGHALTFAANGASRTVSLVPELQPPPVSEARRAVRACEKALDAAQAFSAQELGTAWPRRETGGNHLPAVARPVATAEFDRIELGFADTYGPVLQLRPVAFDGWLVTDGVKIGG